MKLSKLENGQPELFYSLQGEGPTLGKPSVFVRLATCNLKCSYCDSKHTWNSSEAIELTIPQIIHQIKKFGCQNIVITGGEPLLQTKDVWELMYDLPGYSFEIETNGTIIPSFTNCKYNVSPKLENSYNQKEKREKEEVYQWHVNNENSIFKFVVNKKEDLQEVLELIEKYKIPRNKIYLMAEGIDEQILKEKEQWLAQMCLDYQFNFTTRLHIKLWKNQRGK